VLLSFEFYTQEILAKMQLEGTFDESYVTGDNKQLVPTDTMKNTLYVYAKKFSLNCLEVKHGCEK
jgi:urate oxidase